MSSTQKDVAQGKPAAHANQSGAQASVADFAHRLQWNENPYDFPADLKAIVMERWAAYAWARYPTEIRPAALLTALADHAGVAPENVTAAGGSCALIQLTLRAFLEPGDGIVLPAPTFGLYGREARKLHAQVEEVALSPADDYALPVDDLLLRGRQSRARLIALCAPNNPTGTVYTADELRRLIGGTDAVVAVDEAYREFCGQDLRPLLDEFENLILLRTFSKAYAMAGLRVGYALGAPRLIQAMDNLNPLFPLPVFSALAAEVALAHTPRFLARVDDIVAERKRMAAALGNLSGVTLFSSGTNFLLLQFDRDPAPILDGLKREHSLIVSDMAGYPELVNCLRISVGLPQENDWVVEAVGKFCEG